MKTLIGLLIIGTFMALMSVVVIASAQNVHISYNSAPFALHTTDNDFLWTSVNTYYAPASPFGTWSATPEGCYASVPGTGICASPLGTNGYANLGISEDFGILSMNGSMLQNSTYHYKFKLQSNGLWVMTPSVTPYSLGNGLMMLFYQRGELNFGGMSPNQNDFVNGTYVNWEVVKAPKSKASEVLAMFPDASYQPSVSGWIVGMEVTFMENQCYPSSCPIPSSYFGMAFPANTANQLNMAPEPQGQPVTITYTANGISSSVELK
ncbi:MAG: hypothetical protein M1544_00085 [Candidatus Marsarchaeota archaeon]|nr:hypothetical protein [Candidatus Marsarchaeota archaeon]